MTKEQQSYLQMAIVFAIATAVFWGLYGHALQKARVPGDAHPSPFKPFIFIGIAYLVWGVFGGAAAIRATGGNFEFQRAGITWGFIAGSLGAFGALTLTYAVFSGIKAGLTSPPTLVMPIVFGGATAVSVIVAIFMLRAQGTLHLTSGQMFGLPLGLVLAITGIVLIQLYAPHSPPPKKPAAVSAPAETAAPLQNH